MTVSERIIEEASKMFASKGIRGVTMDDIAKEMGVSKRTIYENFKDKDGLLSACINTHVEMQTNYREQIIIRSKNILHAILQTMFEGVSGMEKAHPTFIDDLRKYHFKVWNDILVSHQAKNIQEMGVLLKKGVEDGVFRADINVEIVTRIVNVQLSALCDSEMFPPEKFRRSEVFINIIVNFLRGISTRKGINIIEKALLEKEIEIMKSKK